MSTLTVNGDFKNRSMGSSSGCSMLLDLQACVGKGMSSKHTRLVEVGILHQDERLD